MTSPVSALTIWIPYAMVRLGTNMCTASNRERFAFDQGVSS